MARYLACGFAPRVWLWLFLILTGVYGSISFDGWLRLCAQLLAGLAFAHGVELMHQALHMQGFKSKRLNYWVGCVLGAPMLVSFSAYQDSHLSHHRTLGSPEDKEFFDYGDKRLGLYSIFLMLFMPMHYLNFIEKFLKALVEWDVRCRTKKASSLMRLEYLILGGLVILAMVALRYDVSAVLHGWIVPLVFIAAPLHALVELPEHYGCSKTTRDVFQNTRSISAGRFMTWLTNGNNYHVEHHYRASIPMQQLGRLHQEMRSSMMHLNTSYLDFYVRLFKGEYSFADFDGVKTNNLALEEVNVLEDSDAN